VFAYLRGLTAQWGGRKLQSIRLKNKHEVKMKHQFSMKRLACAVAVAGACAVANAATTDLGKLDVGATAFNGAILGGPAPVTFNDFFTFELPANGGSAYSVLNFPIQQLNLGLAFASLAVYSTGADGVIGGTGANADVVRASTSAQVGTNSQELSINIPAMAQGGKMYLNVAGFTTGSAGGLYSGAISVSPVPEPEVWAMMLVGAGLVGFRLRNRSRKFAANRLA
jgi:hypothetical protein